MSLSRTWVSSLGEFSRQPLMLRLDFHVISLFCLHRALSKIHTWKLFVYGKIFAYGKINSGRKSLGEKKEKKGRPKEERKSTTLSSKEQNSFVKAISTNGASRWRPDFEQRERHLTNFCHT